MFRFKTCPCFILMRRYQKTMNLGHFWMMTSTLPQRFTYQTNLGVESNINTAVRVYFYSFKNFQPRMISGNFNVLGKGRRKKKAYIVHRATRLKLSIYQANCILSSCYTVPPYSRNEVNNRSSVLQGLTVLSTKTLTMSLMTDADSFYWWFATSQVLSHVIC